MMIYIVLFGLLATYASSSPAGNANRILQGALHGKVAVDPFLFQEIFMLINDNVAPHSHRRAPRSPMRLITAMFHAADKNEDGILNTEEFWSTFNKCDGNGDGHITVDEYIGFFTSNRNPARAMISAMSGGAVAQNAKRIFHAGDMDGDEVLTMNDAEIIFESLDNDGNGSVDISEYTVRWEQVLAGLRG